MHRNTTKNEREINRSKTVALAFESAIACGSVALWNENVLIDKWVGEKTEKIFENEKIEKSRIFEILRQVEKMLKTNDIDKKQIGQVIISIGPGSYTGIRNGAATALGLTRALDCRLVAASVLEALSVVPTNRRSDDGGGGEEERIVTAVPFGKEQICRQEFEIADFAYGAPIYKKSSSPTVSSKQNFLDETWTEKETGKPCNLILHQELYAAFFDGKKEMPAENGGRLVNAGGNMALLLGKFLEKASSPHEINERDARSIRLVYINEMKSNEKF